MFYKTSKAVFLNFAGYSSEIPKIKAGLSLRNSNTNIKFPQSASGCSWSSWILNRDARQEQLLWRYGHVSVFCRLNLALHNVVVSHGC